MSRRSYLHACVLVAHSYAFAQTPTIQWQHCLGGSADDEGAAVDITTDGGYVVAGTILSSNSDASGNHGGKDIWVGRLNSSGQLLWHVCLGGTSTDIARDVHSTADGGCVVAGFTYSSNGDVGGQHGDADAWVVKLSSSGETQFQRCLGGTGTEIGESVVQTGDGGYLVAGETNSLDGDVTGVHQTGSVNCSVQDPCPDAWLVKLDPGGVIQWSKTYGGGDFDHARDAIRTVDGGYAFMGYTESTNGDVSGVHGAFDLWMVKVSIAGAFEWQRCLGSGSDDSGYALVQTTDGGYITTGIVAEDDGDVTGFHGSVDMWVARTNGSGTLQWQHALGGSDDENGEALVLMDDGGVVAAGSCMSMDGDVAGVHGGADAWLLRLNGSGGLLWQLPLGGTDVDWAKDVERTADGGYVMVGHTTSNDGDVSGNNGQEDIWVVKLSAPVGMASNPEAPHFVLRCDALAHIITLDIPTLGTAANFTLFDAVGRTVLSGSVGQHHTVYNLAGLSSGAYTLLLRDARGFSQQRFVLQ